MATDRSRDRWIGADPDDHSPDADFRREVAAIYREVVATHDHERRGSGRADVDGGPGSGGRESLPVRAVSPETFDVRGTIPYLLYSVAGLLERELAGQRRTVSGVARDLVLLEVGRRRRASHASVRRTLRIPRSSLSRLVKSLKREGWVAGRPDRRGRDSLLTLTGSGREVAAGTAEVWRKVDAALVRGDSALERDAVRWWLRQAEAILRRGTIGELS